MKKKIRVYQCQDTLEGILTAVYDAGKSRYGHDHIRLQAQPEGYHENFNLFSEYIQVEPDREKMEKVLRTVEEKISRQVCQQIICCAFCAQEDKADVIYHYIVCGFAMGAKVVKALQIPWVQRVFEMNRMITNEAHYYREFIRFQELPQDPPVLLSVIEPKNRILSFVAQHFADRLNPEWFIIYDKAYQEAVFHSPAEGWYIRRLEPEEGRQLAAMEDYQEEYVDLWKTFFEAVSIPERENRDLQRNHLPLHFRSHMPEFGN